MAIPVLMPRQGQSVETCLLLEWKKNEGETVTSGDILCEVETDKASFEVEAPESGVLLKTYFNEGDDVPVLTVIAAIGEEGESVEGIEAQAPSEAPETQQGAAEPAVESVPTTPVTETSLSPSAGRQAVSPRARKRAREKGIDVTKLAGTGPGGRVIERDVLGAAAKGVALSTEDMESLVRPAAAVEVGETTEVPVTGVRKLIAERMLASLQSTAQLTMNGSADARALRKLRARFKQGPEAWGVRDITITDLVLYAVSRLLPLYPEVNSYFLGDRIVQHRAVNLAFAVDTPKGLMVPVIANAHALTLRMLSAEAKRLAAACIEGTITPDELNGGTFTVTNLGNLGVESFTPVLNPPQNGILGVGSIQLKPLMEDGEVLFVEYLGLSLTINHQAVDGAPGARFLQSLVQAIEQVDLILAT